MKTKLSVIFLLFCCFSLTLSAQDEEKKQSEFRKENIFIGSAINLGFSSGVFQLGANPEIGYSITHWLDAGISTNINYTSIRYTGFSDHLFNYGAGTFVRIWPARFLFLTGVPEYNWITVTRKYTNSGLPSDKNTYNAGSLLVGAGYGTRDVGRAYSYFAIMFDALKNVNSPYRDSENRALPIIRAGFAVYLHQKHYRR